jgi:hypothetical protein
MLLASAVDQPAPSLPATAIPAASLPAAPQNCLRVPGLLLMKCCRLANLGARLSTVSGSDMTTRLPPDSSSIARTVKIRGPILVVHNTCILVVHNTCIEGSDQYQPDAQARVLPSPTLLARRAGILQARRDRPLARSRAVNRFPANQPDSCSAGCRALVPPPQSVATAVVTALEPGDLRPAAAREKHF